MDNRRVLMESVQTNFDESVYDFGATLEKESTVFKLFCPRSESVDIELFEKYDQDEGTRFPLKQNDDGIWYGCMPRNLENYYYGYRIEPPGEHGRDFIATDELIADPYSKWVTVRNNYRQEPKSKIIDLSFDWEGDEFVTLPDPRDLIIYEAHLKDMTAHPSSGCSMPGTYKGFAEPDQKGGISHLKNLGVNAVEFMPLQKYPFFEPPYQQETDEGFRNHWNPYARNHWGYMPSFYFTPESRFATGTSSVPGEVCGREPDAINEFKEMVKILHEEDIAVIMDVVYNHVSQYDLNPLKYIDKGYYFRLDENGEFISHSGCGNDLKTEAPMTRKLILDSIQYWMEEFHVDGFRFDLANLMDWDTIREIRELAYDINPHAILIAEPWGKGYNPNGFSQHHYCAWNDQIRNGVKGSHPADDPGYIFGKWQHESSRDALENFIRGTLEQYANGKFTTSEHAVNYLESHDNYTLGDFIRIALDPHLLEHPVKDIEKNAELTGEALEIARIGALYLFVSQGITMISEGQEGARSKVIMPTDADESHEYHLDSDSYEKDNETNHLNYDLIFRNRDLVEYYKGLIELRSNAPALRKSDDENIEFLDSENPLHLTFLIYGAPAGDSYDYLITLNGDPDAVHEIHIPEGDWEMVVNETEAGFSRLNERELTDIDCNISPRTGMVLRRPADT